jgi:hypothetical protein
MVAAGTAVLRADAGIDREAASVIRNFYVLLLRSLAQ